MNRSLTTWKRATHKCDTARNRYFVLFVWTVLSGCTSDIHTWTIQSANYSFEPSARLCEFKGQRLAIIPVRAERGKDVSCDFKSTTTWAVDIARSTGDLRFSVDGGPVRVVEETFEPAESLLGELATILEKMGFEIVDRRHVASVLKEQDLRSAIENDSAHIGGLVGADVLCVVSEKSSPVVYFASAAGSWATQPDPQCEGSIIFVSSATGLHLGTLSYSGSLFGLCGYQKLIACRKDDGASIKTFFKAQHRDGRVVLASNIDFMAHLRSEAKLLGPNDQRKWADLCRIAGSTSR